MELYMEFMVALAFGLLGLGVVLTLLLERLFCDWDAPGEMRERFKALLEGKGISGLERTEDILLEIEKSRAATVNTRLIERKRAQLKEIDAVEHVLRRPNKTAVLGSFPLV